MPLGRSSARLDLRTANLFECNGHGRKPQRVHAGKRVTCCVVRQQSGSTLDQTEKGVKLIDRPCWRGAISPSPRLRLVAGERLRRRESPDCIMRHS